MSQRFVCQTEESLFDAGKRFSQGDFNASDFLKNLLKKEEYAQIADFFNGVCNNDDEYSLLSIAEKSYGAFVSLAEEYGIDAEQYKRLLLFTYKAPQRGALRRWIPAADAFFSSRLKTDLIGTAVYLLAGDSTGLAYNLITQIGGEDGEMIILQELFADRVLNKGKARKIVSEGNAKMRLAESYDELSPKEKEELVKIILADKQSPQALDFISALYANETYKPVRRLIENETVYPLKSKRLRTQQYEYDSKSIYSPVYAGRHYKIRIRNYKVKKPVTINDAAKPVLKKQSALVKAELKEDISCLFERMVSGDKWPVELFLRRLNEDKLFYFLCDKLYFALYDGNSFDGIVLINNGEILDVDGNKVDTEGKHITVAHCMDMRGKYSFLNLQSLDQPFEQVGREFFEAGDRDFTYNAVKRFSNSVITVAQLIKKIRGSGFKLRGKSQGECWGMARLWQGVYCYVRFSRFDVEDKDDFVRVVEVRFYDSADVARSGFGEDFEGVKPMAISDVKTKLFSEFLLTLGRIFGV